MASGNPLRTTGGPRYYTLTAKGRKELDSRNARMGRQLTAILPEFWRHRRGELCLCSEILQLGLRSHSEGAGGPGLNEELGTYLEMAAAER